MKNVIVSAAMSGTITGILDGYSDDKISSCKFVSKKGIDHTFEVESDMDIDALCAYVKKVVKANPKGAALYFSVKKG